MKFDKDFVFGVATSAYQIEGAVSEGNRTPSIWDDFCRVKGAIYDGKSGDVACDHYHRYKEDLALVKELGVDCYRFSISWPRIIPERGVRNKAGIAFYKDILQTLKNSGIKANVTLFHWDLPSWAQALGGWVNRQCAEWFLEFAQTCFEEFGEYADMWATHNEPLCASFTSYYAGVHAPGHINIGEYLRAAHHLLLSHGMAVRLFRQMGLKSPIGIVLNLTPTYPLTAGFADKLACNNHDGVLNRWFLEPLFKSAYPNDIANLFASRYSDFGFVKDGDFDIIAEPCDYLGVNYYSRNIVKYDPRDILLNAEVTTASKKTGIGWDIAPEEFIDIIRMVREKYTDIPIYITENGSAWDDIPQEGQVHDTQRGEYLKEHLEAVSRMNQMGLDVKGYFAWSLLDNFEWSFGYSQRFGLVYVDYDTQKRIKKDSYSLYQEIIRRSRG